MKRSDRTGSPARTKWGRSRFGGSGAVLLAASVGLGGILAIGFAGLLTALDPGRAHSPLLFIVSAVISLPIGAILVWVILVDRASLRDAADDPASSVESRWYERASSGAFNDLVAVFGVGAGVLAFVRVQISPSLVLAGLFALALADFGIRYLVARRRDS